MGEGWGNWSGQAFLVPLHWLSTLVSPWGLLLRPRFDASRPLLALFFCSYWVYLGRGSVGPADPGLGTRSLGKSADVPVQLHRRFTFCVVPNPRVAQDWRYVWVGPARCSGLHAGALLACAPIPGAGCCFECQWIIAALDLPFRSPAPGVVVGGLAMLPLLLLPLFA